MSRGPKISKLETIRILEFPNLVWIRIHTDDGVYGLGETFMASEAVEEYLHYIAHHLIGQDCTDIERLTTLIEPYVGARGSGVEKRAQSAVNIALWDLSGKLRNLPLYVLLGGKVRQEIRLYNTCAGYKYMRQSRSQLVSNWGLGEEQGPYEDLEAFLYRSDELALSLLEMEISAMKIWPFDIAAERNLGLHISTEEMNSALRSLDRIRSAVGDRMDIMVEFHSLWSLPPALKIAQALKPFKTYWHEDPVRMNSLSSLKTYQDTSEAPICASETISGKHGYRDLIEAGFKGIVMADISWCGGISEARNIAAISDAWDLPITFHDCTGPVVLAASAHLAVHARNSLIQEFVRASYYGWYKEVVTGLPLIDKGYMRPSDRPGLGIELIPDRLSHTDVRIRETTTADI